MEGEKNGKDEQQLETDFNNLKIQESKEGIKQEGSKEETKQENNSEFDKLYTEINNAIFTEKRNIYISGPGGTGKSTIIKKIYNDCIQKGINVALTSTTGVSAHSLGVGARTLHSWSAIKLGKEHPDIIIKRIRGNKVNLERWINCSILIIDEISMCSAEIIELLDIIGQNLRLGKREMFNMRKHNTPVPCFGGLQIIASGDMLQLEPVNGTFLFKSNIWKSINFKNFRLTTPYRYPDLKFYELLLRAREGKLNNEDISLLKTRVKAYEDYKKAEKQGKTNVIKPTRIYSLKRDVDTINLSELDSLEGDTIEYECTDLINPKKADDKSFIDKESYTKYLDTIAPRQVFLKPNAQVMLTVNLSIEDGLVNGSRGIITECCDEIIKVQFKSGISIIISPHPYEFEDEVVKCVRYQFPLMLAWSITTHKCQGATLDSAIIDLGTSLFCASLGYVALSRCRTLDGIYIVNIIPDKIRANEEALEFDKNLVNN
jgi:ATP-dependent DNA helicase PIF1